MRPIVMALLAAALFGASSPAAKVLVQEINPFQLAGLLYLGAALAVLPGIIKNKSLPLPWKIEHSNRRRLFFALLFGGIIAPVLLLFALQIASATSISMWLTMEAVFTAMLAHKLFQEDLGKNGWLAVVCAACASGALSFTPYGSEAAAAGLALGACLCWALDNNLTSVIDAVKPEEITFLKGVVAGVINLTLGLMLAPMHIAPSLMVAGLLIGGFCYGLSLLLYIHAAQKLGASRSQMIFASAPFWGVFFSFLLLHEQLSPLEAGCGLMFAFSLTLLFKDRHSHEHAHEEMEHVHEHTHDDGHHNHVHEGEPDSLRHSHWHKHEAKTHSHPHWPDLHHRHGH